MQVKVSDVMRHVRNYFIREAHTASWSLADGVLTPADHFAPGQWIAIAASDAASPRGVFQLDDKGGLPGCPPQQWDGTIFRLDPPADFLRLCGEIAHWAERNPDPAAESEKLGVYSVTRRCTTWQAAFASALAPYRRMFPEVQG